jgi:hypothetical protein
MLISLQRVVVGTGVDNLTVVIMEALQKAKSLSLKSVAQKLLCFGADGISTFQGTKIGVIQQINTKYAPFSIGIHYMVQR